MLIFTNSATYYAIRNDPKTREIFLHKDFLRLDCPNSSLMESYIYVNTVLQTPE